MESVKLILPTINNCSYNLRSFKNHTLLHYSSLLKLQERVLLFSSSSSRGMLTSTVTSLKATASDNNFKKTSELPNVAWDNLGFDPVVTDFIYMMKCCGGEQFSNGELQPYGKIELNPFSSVLNYGQGIIEDLKAYKKEDNCIVLFRPEVHGLRMRVGADRLCMPSLTINQFVEAVKATVSANRRWIPPPNKGFLHIRPLLIGSGAVLSLTSSPEFIFLIYVTPVKNYFEGGPKPINVVVATETHHAVPGGVGSIKAIGNYAAIMKAQTAAKANGFDDVLYLDSVYNRYLEEFSTASVFIVKDKIISTPALRGTILSGVTRESVIDIAHSLSFQVEERLVAVEELFAADEVFIAGNAGLVPVGTITYIDKRVSYRGGGLDSVYLQLYSTLTNIQMGLKKDIMGWTVLLNHKLE